MLNHPFVPENLSKGFPCDIDAPDIETSSDDYALRFAGEIGAYFLKIQERIALDLLKPYPGGRVLDIGGGHAQIAVPLVENGYNVTVTGSSEVCRKRLDNLLKPGSFQFKVCRLISLPFESKSFDAVLAFRLLPHVVEWKRLISEMCRVSRRVVVIDYPDLRSFNIMSERFFRVKKALEGNTRPFRCFRRAEIVREFKKVGFVLFKIKPEFFFPMAIHRSMGSAWLSRVLEFLSSMTGITSFFGSPVVLRASRKECCEESMQ